MASNTAPAYPKDEHPSTIATFPTDRTVTSAPMASGNPIHEGTEHSRMTPNRSSSDSISRHKQIDPPAFTDRKDNSYVDEKGLGMHGSEEASREREEIAPSKYKRFSKKYMWVFHTFLVLLFTAWFIVGVVLHRKDRGWLIPFLLWLCIVIRFVTAYMGTKFVTTPIKKVWMAGAYGPWHKIPEKFRTIALAAVAVGAILIGTFATEETDDNSRANRCVSIAGLILLIGLFYLTSRNQKAVVWQTVIVGMLAQFLLALFVLRSKGGYDIFNFVAFLATTLLGFSAKGTAFLFNDAIFDSHYFVIGVLPPIIFFVAFVQLLYYWGILQWAVKKFATVFFYTMKVSGAEAVVAAASPFVGQGESAMLIKPFIPHLTDSELHAVMTAGFATIAGSVLAAYIAMGISPIALVSSCVMSIPASLAISKLRWPEEEETLTAGEIVIPEDNEERPSNFLHAFANGAFLGLKVAGLIAAALLCILALLGLVNALLTWWGRYLNIDAQHTKIDALTIEAILGYVLWPVAFFLGVDRANGQVLLVARLIGIKVVGNEFLAFQALSDPNPKSIYRALSPRSELIATYAVCGFGNIASVGIQIGVLSTLAPGKAGRVSKVAISALISGVFATLSSASIAGMLLNGGLVVDSIRASNAAAEAAAAAAAAAAAKASATAVAARFF